MAAPASDDLEAFRRAVGPHQKRHQDAARANRRQNVRHDLGFGFPELGSVSLAELASVKGRLGLGIERDLCLQGALSALRLRPGSVQRRPHHRSRAAVATGGRGPWQRPFQASARHGGTDAPLGAKTAPPRRLAASAAGNPTPETKETNHATCPHSA
ncbi:DUF2958 domain-containing protein [Mesorhizobium norvegicum]|uniref:DUF2958 domain-containing protein n=1 Tax=Mesorhizobium norvegicum TaxID=1085774 RepID=UPI003CCC75B2